MHTIHTQPAVLRGAPLEQAQAALVLIHGRGSNAYDLLDLAREWSRPDWAYVGLQASQGTWYPQRFLAPLGANEPWLSAALAAVQRTLEQTTAAGIPLERTVLLGFSQGACLALEYAVRNRRRYGGVVGLSGGLIGPAGTSWDYPGALDGTPVFLGCSDSDAHIPALRVQESATALQQAGAQVTARLYASMGHTINADEVAWVAQLVAQITPATQLAK